MDVPAYFSTTPSSKKDLKVFGDMASQPTRAILMFCEINKIPYTFVPVRVQKMEHKGAENLQRNPFGQIPAIDDGGFVVFESHAILQYLSQKYEVADHWYPKDIYARARVDQYLHWHHQNTRKLAPYSFSKVFAPRFGIPVTEKDIEEYSKNTHKALKAINDVWLANRNFLTGDKMTIADVSAICEIAQLKFVKYSFDKYPNVAAWIPRMEALPAFQSVHQVVFKILSKL